MKAIKYLFVGVLLTASASALAQEVNYKTFLPSIAKELKANSGNALAAKDLVKKYEKTFKKDPEALIALGYEFFNAKTYDKANELADLVLAKNKNMGAAYILKGDIAAIQDNGGDASMWYEQAMRMDPKNAEGYVKFASVNRKANPVEAENAWKELKKQIPDFPVEAEAAPNFYITGNMAKAIEYFEKCDINKLEKYRLSEFSTAAYYAGNQQKSLEIANFAANKFPKEMGFQRQALRANNELGNYQDALANAEKILNDTCKKTTFDYNNYGKALKGIGQYDKAIAQYNKAMELDNQDIKPLQYISEAYQAAGNEDKALEYNQKYMDKNENATPSDYVKLASIYVDKAKKGVDAQANIAQANKIYETIASKFPSIAGWVYNQAGNSSSDAGFEDLGASYYQKTIDLYANKADRDADETKYLIQAYQLIGYYYWATKNDLEAAKPYYEKLLILSPDDKNAKAALTPVENTTEATESK